MGEEPPAEEPDTRIVFVTSETFQGDLGKTDKIPFFDAMVSSDESAGTNVVLATSSSKPLTRRGTAASIIVTPPRMLRAFLALNRFNRAVQRSWPSPVILYAIVKERVSPEFTSRYGNAIQL